MRTGFYLVALTIVASLTAACAPGGTDAEAVARPALVETHSVALSAGYDSIRRYSGRVEAVLDSRLGFEVGGHLTSVLVDEGDVVRQGDILAQLDTARLDAQRAEALAGLARIEADLTLAETTLDRVADAFTYKGVSGQQLDEARQRVNALTASRDVAASNVERIDVDIRKSVLVAVFDGAVTRRFVDPGTVVSAGAPVLQVQSSNDLEARIGVAPDAAITLTVDRTYELSVNGSEVPAKLRAVINARDSRTRTVDALFTILENDASVRSGDTVELQTSTWNDTPGFWLPLSALVEGQRGLWRALVADSNGDDNYTLEGHVLEVLYADSENAFVRGTLQTGDRLVSAGTQRVVEGQVVRIHGDNSPSRVAATGGQDVN